MFEGGATNYAESVDSVMLFIVGVSVVLLLGITFTMIYFVFKYNRKRNPKATQIHGNVLLEITWIVIPTIIVIVMFWYGYKDYDTLRKTGEEDITINVWGYMWGWNFEYPNGKMTDTLYVSADHVTKLNLESRDVNHSLYIPAFRLKEDVIAGRKNYMHLTPAEPGKYDIACAEYCGLDHSQMYTKVFVLPQDKFDEWYNDTTGTVKIADSSVVSQVSEGDGGHSASSGDASGQSGMSKSEYRKMINKPENRKLFVEKNCVSCHTLDGSNSVGPSFLELANGKVKVKTEDGSLKQLVVDDKYLRESIEKPNKYIVEGYRKFMMPSQKNIVNDDELEEMIRILNPNK